MSPGERAVREFLGNLAGVGTDDVPDSAVAHLVHLARTAPPTTTPCVGSGYCCKSSPCPHGQRDPNSGWCIHLMPWEGDELAELGVERYRCARYEFIRQQPFAELIPAFGAGCGRPHANVARARVLIALRIRKGSPGLATGHGAG